MEFESSIASHRATPVIVEIWIIRDLQNFSNYNGVREEAMRGERRGSRTRTPAAIQNAIGCVAVLFFSRVPVSFPLFLLPLSFTFELSLRKTWFKFGSELLH